VAADHGLFVEHVLLAENKFGERGHAKPAEQGGGGGGGGGRGGGGGGGGGVNFRYVGNFVHVLFLEKDGEIS
jgi:hypothetical protein